MDRPKRTAVMLEVHTKGKGVCGVYTHEIAETKVAQVISIHSSISTRCFVPWRRPDRRNALLSEQC